MSDLIKLTFKKAGLLTLVVDDTKVGYQNYGIPVGGPMDTESAELANWLVGNDTRSALLEINVIGPEIQCESNCQIALTGANISPTLNGTRIKMYETLTLGKDDILKFGELRNGCRSYLAIRGSWNVTDWMQNDSPKNRPNLRNLNRIEIRSLEKLPKSRTAERLVFSGQPLVINVIKGPEFEHLTEDAVQTLLHTNFDLLPESNRMGYRLAPNVPSIGSSIISSGVIPGTLQITEDGCPIMLMKDAPTTGGYVRAFNVVTEDISKLGQLKAGDSLAFNLI